MTKIAQLVGFSYLDDCDMVQSDDDIEANLFQMKLTLQKWEDLIRITGGYLVPDKIAWYQVDYEWRRGKWKLMNPGQDKLL